MKPCERVVAGGVDQGRSVRIEARQALSNRLLETRDRLTLCRVVTPDTRSLEECERRVVTIPRVDCLGPCLIRRAELAQGVERDAKPRQCSDSLRRTWAEQFDGAAKEVLRRYEVTTDDGPDAGRRQAGAGGSGELVAGLPQL